MGHEPCARSRRTFLSCAIAVTGTTAIAGCTALWDQTGATDVVMMNVASDPKSVSIEITDTDADDPHTSRTLEIAPGEEVDPVNRSKLPTNTSYTVDVDVDNGPSETFEWDDPRVELAPLYVLIDDTRNIKFLLHAG